MYLSELKTYIKSVTKKQVIRQMQSISEMALATQGEGKDIKKTIKQMEKALDKLN